MAFSREFAQIHLRMPGLGACLRVLCALLICVSSACREKSGANHQRTSAVSRTTALDLEDHLYDEGALDPLLAALRPRLGSDMMALVFEIQGRRATIQVEAPTRPGQVVQYEWERDRLRGPIPVELRGSGTLETNLFRVSTVDLKQIPRLANMAVERVDREHGKVERIVVRRNLPADSDVGIRVYVESPIRSGHLDADARGRISDSKN